MTKQELARKIWNTANELRDKIEASEYKDYILGFIFYKFLSDHELEFLRDNYYTEEDIEDLQDDDENADFVKGQLGYIIPYKYLYSTWRKDPDFGIQNVTDGLNRFKDHNISAQHKKVYEGIFDTLLTGLSKLGSTSQEQTKAAKELLELIEDIPMSRSQDYDTLGFIYEYLISNFAANAGKKAGEFYTPHEVSILMSEIIAYHLRGQENIKIYDPCSGSGSLLLNIGQSVAKHLKNKNGIQYYAQELKENTYNLTRMNLVMKGILPDNIITRWGDSLDKDWPLFESDDNFETTYTPLFDLSAVTMNPPYSQKWKPQNKENDPRFSEYGVAPKGKADYAFLLHGFYHLKQGGIQTIVLPHGVLFRGASELDIRKALVEKNCIDTIIGLPANIFFGTGIPTIIMILKKGRTDDNILIIDASKGFRKEGKNNKLRACDIKKIVDTYIARKDVEKYARVVTRDEVRANDYNLNIPRYVDSSEPAEPVDIYATMFGGLPKDEINEKFSKQFDVFKGLSEALFEDSDTPYTALRNIDVKSVIESTESVKDFKALFRKDFEDFPQYLDEKLINGMENVNIQSGEGEIADDIFKRFDAIPLCDKYEAYQILHENWLNISEDLEKIQGEGKAAIIQVDPNMVKKKDKNGKEHEVQDGFVGHVIPFDLVQREYLKDDVVAIESLSNEVAEISNKYDELLESIDEEDRNGTYISEDGTKFVPKDVKEAIKDYIRKKKPEIADEGSLEEKLIKVYRLNEKEKELNSSIRKAKAELHLKTKEKIESLTDEEQKSLLYKKWIEPLVSAIDEMPGNVISDLEKQIIALYKKYEFPSSTTDHEIKATEKDLVGMLKDLSGNSYDDAGLEEFIKQLGGV